jgi:hypothetical protein
MKLRDLINEAKFEGSEYSKKGKKEFLRSLKKDMKAIEAVEKLIKQAAERAGKEFQKAETTKIEEKFDDVSDKLYKMSSNLGDFYNKQVDRHNKLEKLDPIDEAIFWGGNTNKAFKTNEDATYEPVNTNTAHDVQTEAKGMDTKTFLKAVKDEFDVETLQMMQTVIQKQITLVQKMGDMANPRKTVKGFRK